jgi:SRSO17 transposase
VAGAQYRSAQRLQFFLSESRWDAEQVNSRRLELLLADPATAPHGGGVLVIDDSGDRKDGTKTAHVGHPWLSRYGKTDNGVVTVTTVWADERLYYPVDAVPYTPAKHFAKRKSDARPDPGAECRQATHQRAAPAHCRPRGHLGDTQAPEREKAPVRAGRQRAQSATRR